MKLDPNKLADALLAKCRKLGLINPITKEGSPTHALLVEDYTYVISRCATKTIYVLVRSHNAYDQYGKYFVKAFDHKPSATEIVKAVKADCETRITLEYAQHILKVGGRKSDEDTWWNLKQITF